MRGRAGRLALGKSLPFSRADAASADSLASASANVLTTGVDVLDALAREVFSILADSARTAGVKRGEAVRLVVGSSV